MFRLDRIKPRWATREQVHPAHLKRYADRTLLGENPSTELPTRQGQRKDARKRLI